MIPHVIENKSSIVIERSIFKLSGSDNVRFLNGQCTQDVRLVSNDEALYAAITDFKGRMDGDCYIRKLGNDILIDSPIALQQSLFERLDRFIIADDVDLKDITNSYVIAHTFNPDLDNHPNKWRCNRFGQTGQDQLCIKSSAPSSTLTISDVEKVRISHKVPQWGTELDHQTLPPEAGLEERAISYNKGCYTGQEIISRMRSSGKTNRHIILLKMNFQMPIGSPLLCDGASEDKPAGIITSTCEINGQQIALAYRKRKFQDIDAFTNATVIKT